MTDIVVWDRYSPVNLLLRCLTVKDDGSDFVNIPHHTYITYFHVHPDDDDRQARFWRRRPDGFSVNEKEHVIYVLEFKGVTDTGEKYVSETQRLVETQHLAITQGLKSLFKDTQWTVE